MPFDGHAQHRQVEIINKMEELFHGGARWRKGEMYDIHGNMCLVGAMRMVCQPSEYDVMGDIFYEIIGYDPVLFNDARQTTYADIKALLALAMEKCNAV